MKPKDTFTQAVPAKLQLDSWWLDHSTRPFPKRIVPVTMAKTMGDA